MHLQLITKWMMVQIIQHNIITNLSNLELTEDEKSVPTVGLKHDLLIRPRENTMGLDIKQFLNEKKKTKEFQHLRDRCMVLKPYKEQCIVLIKKLIFQTIAW